jgi:hypothetical protein
MSPRQGETSPVCKWVSRPVRSPGFQASDKWRRLLRPPLAAEFQGCSIRSSLFFPTSCSHVLTAIRGSAITPAQSTRSLWPTGYQMKTNSQPKVPCVLYDLSILFLFSLRLRRSTRFACILAASSAYLSFSSFAARLSLIAWTFLCKKTND